MAYNSGFPITYQPYYPQAYQAPQQPSYASQGQSNNGIIWVQGEAGAKSYLVAPNTTVVLFDSESQTIYLKSADATGLPSMRVLDYTIRDQQARGGALSQPVGDFVTKSEMDALRAELEQIKARLKGAGNESTVQRNGE